MTYSNPFEYDAAPNLPPRDLVKWYISDYNFSRFLESSRNVLINGERGSGKSMALIYNSLPYQLIRHEEFNEPFPSTRIGIYIPCNTPLTHKKEHFLLDDAESRIISEHYLISNIGISIAASLVQVESFFSDTDKNILIDEFSFICDIDKSDFTGPFTTLKRYFHSKLKNNQERINSGVSVDSRIDTSEFYTTILPLLESIRQTSLLFNAHISLMFDDAHDLNIHQRELLNSWLGYRDHSVFSFKIAIAGLKYYDLRTLYGGTLLEGHDFITLDLERPYQNEYSDFGKFASAVVDKRLKAVGISIDPDLFFPEDDNFDNEIHRYKEITRDEAVSKGLTTSKSISDYVYKYARARYFQERSAKANKPVYAGFNTLTHLSTGVIRNLLDPCYWMYDYAISNGYSIQDGIPSNVQNIIIHSRSEKKWEFIRDKLSTCVEGCGVTEAKQLKNFFEKLAEFFHDRLLRHKSEPRVLSFTVSSFTDEMKNKLLPMFRLAQQAQLLYIRPGTAKDGGGKEDFYTPNRILWPAYGLDIVGQHGRASIQAIHLWNAANDGAKIPMKTEDVHHDVILRLPNV